MVVKMSKRKLNVQIFYNLHVTVTLVPHEWIPGEGDVITPTHKIVRQVPQQVVHKAFEKEVIGWTKGHVGVDGPKSKGRM